MTKRKTPVEESPSKRASVLAEAHWKYVKELLTVQSVGNPMIDIIGFHYRTAMIHGYKHGFDDTKKRYENLSPLCPV